MRSSDLRRTVPVLPFQRRQGTKVLSGQFKTPKARSRRIRFWLIPAESLLQPIAGVYFGMVLQSQIASLDEGR